MDWYTLMAEGNQDHRTVTVYDGSDEGPGGVTRGWSCYMSGGRGSCSVTDSTLTMIRLLYVLHQQKCTGNAGKTTHM